MKKINSKKSRFYCSESSQRLSNGQNAACKTCLTTKQTIRKMDSKEEQFTELVREHKGTIYTVCYMFSKDNDEVSDLFQDILVNLWKGFERFEQRSDIRTWFYRVALNTCINADKKKKRHKSVPLTLDINLYEDNDTDTRQVRMLYERINKLGAFDRAIMLLWLDSLSYDDIGAVMGLTAKNVSVRLVRIREQLKQMK